MRFLDEYRDRAAGERLLAAIHRVSHRPVAFMEFCGSHTVSIFKYGLRQLLPPHIRMLSGPGCPVCVTAAGDIDRVIALAALPGVITVTFGDLVRVPGTVASLAQARAEGHDIRVVYSALEALDIARANPACKVVLIGIGFETTAPTIAASLLTAREERLANYAVLSLHKLTPPAMRSILAAGEIHLDGILCPGHVSVVIGTEPYRFIVKEYGLGCAVAGFEPLDILLAVSNLVTQAEEGRPEVSLCYPRAVRPLGNAAALDVMYQVFEPATADWRGIGCLPHSGLALKEEFAAYDAARLFEIPRLESREPEGCLCGAVLRGVKTPRDCRLFGRSCTPVSPVGPCMVSTEGACAAYYQYGDAHE